MKNKTLLILTSIISLCSCSKHNLSYLYKPAKSLSIYEANEMAKNEEYKNYFKGVLDFSSSFTDSFIKLNKPSNKENIGLSPISAYSALSMASAITSGDTKEEILKSLCTNEKELNEYYKYLYAFLDYEYKTEFNQISYKSYLSNSIWLDSNLTTNDELLSQLANNFYSYSIKEDFLTNPSKANSDISKFIYKQTNKLLNVNLNLDQLTKLVLLNCFYLKDLWDEFGNNISLADGKYDFRNGDNSITSTYLMADEFRPLRILKEEKFSSYYTSSHGGTRIYFMLPNEGETVYSIFSDENIKKTLAYNYFGIDEENKILYHSKNNFPSFETSCNKNLIPTLKYLGVKSLFDNPDFTNFTNEKISITDIKHITKLKVDRKGIEGTSITAIIGDGATGPLDGYTEVFEEFIVDKAFGYIVTTYDNIPLFSGIVNTINKL